ncbi:hypothetical protein RHSIM_Rhsim06G0092300 [Rhododendron simsii]|uniref:Uncharacterized protein n=1 Tax=Rhododendron simsii TaxID=118357 RepID=A0A834H650_RHOSS|nr:hypothetical protein RHSIM_Rhsim06G0092300 [Rhododendron simsii]
MKVDDIMMLKDLPMRDFETKVWDAVDKYVINKEDRIQGAEFQVFSSQNRLGSGPDGLHIYLAFYIQDNDSAEDETNHDNNSEMNCVKSFKAFQLLNACR